jgi:hypothetical protein
MKSILICFVVLIMFMDLGAADYMDPGPKNCKCLDSPKKTESCCDSNEHEMHGKWTGEHCEFPKNPFGNMADCCEGGMECVDP